MTSFVCRPMLWAPLRAFSRNPLIRASDRIEAAAATLAFLAVIVAAACAGAVGTLVHDARGRVYSEEARTRHLVVASAVADSAPVPASPGGIVQVRSQWRLNGTDYTGELDWNNSLKASDSLPIWVDDHGRLVDPPSPASRAAAQAVVAGAVTFFAEALFVAGMLSYTRSRVAGMCDAQWQRDLEALDGYKGGHSNTSP